MDFDDMKTRRKPRTRSLSVPLDGAVLDNLERLEDEVRRAEVDDGRYNRPPLAPRLRADLEQARRDAEGDVATFTFAELPRPVYRDLIAAHPSKKADWRWDEETFAPALLAASCTDPVLTPEQAQELWDTWGTNVCLVLFGAAVLVCEGPTRVPFGGSSTASTGS